MKAAMQAPNKHDRTTYRAVMAERQASSKVSRGDRVYFIYVAALLILTVAPSVFAAARFLVISFGLNTDQTFLTGLLGVLSIAFVLTSRVRGPVTSSLSDIDFLLASPMDWAAIHSRTGALWVTISALVGGLVCAVLGILEFGPDLETLFLITLSGAGAGLGLYLWFTGGQWVASFASRRPYCLVLTASAIIAVAGVLGVGAVNPAAWVLALVGLPVPFPFKILFSMILIGILLGMAVFSNRLAARQISREYLRRQEWAWSSAIAGAFSLNPQIVSEAVLKERNYLRYLNLGAIPGWLHPAVARDLLGAVRRWPRSTFSLLVAAAAAIIVSAEPGSLVACLLGAVLLTFAGRMSSVGLRAHAENLGRSILLERQTVLSLFAHLLVPLAIMCVGATIGFAVSWPAGPEPSPGWIIVVALIIISLCAQGVPAYSTQLPWYLMGPVITPAGDLSVFAIGGWLMRIYVLSLVAAWSIHTASTAGTFAHVTAWTAIWGAIAAAWSWQSLRQERMNSD